MVVQQEVRRVHAEACVCIYIYIHKYTYTLSHTNSTQYGTETHAHRQHAVSRTHDVQDIQAHF